MPNDIRFEFYKGYIADATVEVLDNLKKDISKDISNKKLDVIHYSFLLRKIAKKKKEILINI